MKKNLIVLFLIFVSFLRAQKGQCDCIVKVAEAPLKVQLLVAKLSNSADIPEKYYPIRPKKGQTYAFHKVIKDSAKFWIMNPNFRENAGQQSRYVMDKLPSAFTIDVQFNKLDSIPLYAEADEKSKILKCIHDNQNEGSNEYWFARCSNGFVKITGFDKRNNPYSGWIKKENYLSK